MARGSEILCRVALLVLLVGTTCFSQSGQTCPSVSGQASSCVCKSTQGIIDLTPLDDKQNPPRYIPVGSYLILDLLRNPGWKLQTVSGEP